MVGDTRRAGVGDVSPEALASGFMSLCEQVRAEGRGEQLDSLCDFLEHGEERWNERLLIHNASMAENYINGRLRLAVKLKPVARLNFELSEYHWYAVYNSTTFKADVSERAAFATDSDVSEFCDGEGGNQKVALVPVIKLPNDPQLGVPSFVGLYCIKDQAFNPLQGQLYKGLSKLVYQILPFFVHGEPHTGPGIWFDAASQAHPTIIECASHIVYSISSKQRNFDGDGLGGIDPDTVLSGIGIHIIGDSIRVSLNKNLALPFDFEDILLGPFDF